MCITSIAGDPRITGLQGQDFQVHGTPNEYFNLITSSDLQVNSRFIYLDAAKCDNFTACFSHPGTYIDEVGVFMGSDRIRVVAGGIETAARVYLNSKEVFVTDERVKVGSMSVLFNNRRRIVIKTQKVSLSIAMSDGFFNVDTSLLATALLDEGSKFITYDGSYSQEPNTVMHGLIGQTWRNNLYAGEREYEGSVADYQVTDGLWGHDFYFNLYKH